MNTVSFRYPKFIKLVKVFASLGLVFAFYAWNASISWELIYYLPFLAVAGLVVFLLIYGDYLFDRFRLDEAGLTVKRPFRRNLRFDYKDLRSFRQQGDLLSEDKAHMLILGTGHTDEYRILLDEMKYGKRLVELMEKGMDGSTPS